MNVSQRNLVYVYYRGFGSKSLVGRLSSRDRLRFVGDSGMGALSYEPGNADASSDLPDGLDEIDR